MNILQSIQEESTAADCPSQSNQDVFSCQPGNQNESHVLSSGHKTDEQSDSPENIVPIVVRLGQIRFGRAGIFQLIKNQINLICICHIKNKERKKQNHM
jgi:hypothetical protein